MFNTDYSNTIFYKISCKNENISDVYIGHTTNFIQRQKCHKHSSQSMMTPNSKCKVYNVIRANGGWDNWNMAIIDFKNCNDLTEARKREQELFIEYNATLNSVEPMPKPKPKKTILDLDAFTQSKFNCEKCNFKCGKKSNYDTHILTAKHINRTKMAETEHYNAEHKFTCGCGKVYKHQSGLCKHKKKCKGTHKPIKDNTDDLLPEPIAQNQPVDMSMVVELLKQNQDFKDLMMEQAKQFALQIQQRT